MHKNSRVKSDNDLISVSLRRIRSGEKQGLFIHITIDSAFLKGENASDFLLTRVLSFSSMNLFILKR